MFFAAVLPLRSMPPLFKRYGVGEHYGNHVDDGRELVLRDTYGEHEVKLDAGEPIVYPSTSVHRVEPVTQGERIRSFFRTQSMIRDDSRRSMLYELDRTIESLRARLGDCQETVALTAHYHKLLRQWAET